MSTAPPVRPAVAEPRFRDALGSLPGRVWIVSPGILVNRVGNFLPVFIVLYLTGRGYSAGAYGSPTSWPGTQAANATVIPNEGLVES